MKTLSLADQAYDIIKTKILNLTYPPDMPLTESALAEELGMSRNPVRTAIKMLQTEGLIVTDFHKSMTVKGISKNDIVEIYQLRRLIEGGAFQMIFDTGRAEEYSYRIEEKVVRMCATASDLYQWELADARMHQEIVSIYENSRITRIYENYMSELIRMGQFSIKNGMEINQMNANLKEMVLHMRSNDYQKALAILQDDHFTIAMDSALKTSQS